MRYEDSYGDEGNYLDDFAVYNPANNLAVTPNAAQPVPQPTNVAPQSWGTGGLGSYQLSDPSLAATPDWLKNRDPSLNRVDWGGNYDPVTGRLGVLPFFVGGSEAQDASYFQDGDTSNMAGYAGVLETGLPTYNISTEFGRPVDNYLKLNPAAENPVRIINASKGEIAYEGAGDPQGLVNALDQATADGNKDIWSAQAKVGDQWVTTHKNEPIGNLVRDVALPAMLAVAGGAGLGPLLGGAQGSLLGAGKLAAAAGAGLGSAAGSFTGNIAAGKSLEDALKAAAISGVTAGVLKGVMPGGTGAGGPSGTEIPFTDVAPTGSLGFGLNAPSTFLPTFANPITGALGSAASGSLPSVVGTNELLAQAPRIVSNVAPSVIAGGAAAGAAPAILGAGVDGPLATVTGTTTDAPPLAGVSAGAPEAIRYIASPTEVAGDGGLQTVEQTRVDQQPTGPLAAAADAALANQAAAAVQEAELLSEAKRIEDQQIDGGLAAAANALAPSQQAPAVQEAELLSEAKRIEDQQIDGGLAAAAGTTPVLGTGTVGQEAVVTGKTDTDGGLPAADTLRNIVGAAEVLGNQPATAAEEALVTGKFMDDTNIGGGLPAAVGTTQVLGTGTVGQEAVVTGAKDKPTGPGVTVYTPPASVETIQQTAKGISDAPEIVVTSEPTGATGKFGAVLPGLAVTMPAMAAVNAVAGGTTPPSTTDKIVKGLEVAGLALPIIDALTGGGDKGAAGTGTYNSGRGALNPLFSAKLPTPGTAGAFTVGGLTPNPPAARSVADYYRYAMGPAMDLPAGVDLSRATSPYAGFGPGTLGEETFNRITTGMARGGPMGYARGSSRESFAVEGPGTGRSDDIPAVLSDGEYVIDAETVALLGDGSSRAGAKKLDELRVKVRKHKGKNLAKGKFSVNAKHPEAYMRGGRI